jgi:hypothetical protein
MVIEGESVPITITITMEVTPMRFTRKHSDCNDGTCPAIWDTDDPALVGVQGAVTPVRPPGAPIPPGEQVVLIPRELLDSYLKESP